MKQNKLPYIIGLTGSIASGKSTAAGYLVERYGLYAIDADRVGHEALETEAVQNRLTETFGPEVVRDHSTDRRALGRIVFADPEKLMTLNAITHPVIGRMIREKIRAYAGIAPVLIEAYGLLQSDLKELVDTVWTVVCDPAIRIRRVMRRQGLTEEEARSRILSQWSDEEYRKKADIAFDGSGSEEALKKQLDEAMQALRKRGLR